MWTPTKLTSGFTVPYGFGWAVIEVNGHPHLVEHDGAWQGFMTHIARYVDDKLTVILLTNSANAKSAGIAHKVAGLVPPTANERPRRQFRRCQDQDVLGLRRPEL